MLKTGTEHLEGLRDGRTVYIGSFSKNLATGLRIGYVTGAEGFTDPLIAAIRAGEVEVE